MRRVDIEVPKLGERPHGTSVGPPPNPKRSQGGGGTPKISLTLTIPSNSFKSLPIRHTPRASTSAWLVMTYDL